MIAWLKGGAVMLVGGLLLGCADAQLGSLDEELQQIRAAPGAQQPLVVPDIPEYQALGYAHDDSRSPFLAPDAVMGEVIPEQGASYELAPDQDREPEPLEHFSLQELTLVGVMRMSNRQRALVRTPDGDVISVTQGQYIGPDHGRIVGIDDKMLRIDERVFSQRHGWQEREALLELNDGN